MSFELFKEHPFGTFDSGDQGPEGNREWMDAQVTIHATPPHQLASRFVDASRPLAAAWSARANPNPNPLTNHTLGNGYGSMVQI